MQCYGTHTTFIACSDDIQASVMRHGAGNICAARIATNIVEAKQDALVCKTQHSIVGITFPRSQELLSPNQRPRGQRLAGAHTHAPTTICLDMARNNITTTGARQRAPIKYHHLNAKTD